MKKNPFSVYVYVLVCVLSTMLVACDTKPKAKHLVIIGLDGLSSVAYQQADMPFLKSQAETGAYALKKRACLPSASAINWRTMFTGSNPELHGYLTWGSKVPDMEQRLVEGYETYPTVFTLIHQQRPEAKVGYFYDWDGMKHVCDTTALTHFGSSGTLDDVWVLAHMAEEYLINERPDVVMFAFAQPDHIGHAIGWIEPDYMTMVTRLDSCVQTIVEATKKAGMYDDCIFVVLADHGGRNHDKGHGKTSMDEMEAPFIIWGKNIRPVGSLDAQYSVMNFDIGAILADICGVTPPLFWTGRSVLPIFEK